MTTLSARAKRVPTIDSWIFPTRADCSGRAVGSRPARVHTIAASTFNPYCPYAQRAAGACDFNVRHSLYMPGSNGPLRVLLTYDDSLDRSTGVAHYVTTLGAFLQGAGHTVAYAAGDTAASRISGASVYSLASNIPVSFNGNRLSMPLRTYGGQLDAVVADFAPDVLHVQMPYSPILTAG